MPVGVIESLSHEAQGIARLEGKTVFVEGALPGETVEYSCFRRKPNYELATTERVLKESSQRVEPRCPHFGTCGGCSMQHLGFEAQIAVKQRVLEDSLAHISKLKPEQLYLPVYGQPWEYRYRTRLSVRLVPRKGGVLVGFHERRSSYVADIRCCPILPRRVSDLLLPLRGLVASLSISQRLPQVEIAIGGDVVALVFRVLEPPSDTDLATLTAFAQAHQLVVFLQPKGPDSVTPLWPAQARDLSYKLPDFDVELFFSPTDFTQVNHGMNAVLVRRALSLLAPAEGERIADLFCGLGNFTLPIARSGASVLGIEGSAKLVQRAERNAVANGLGDLARFRAANLFEIDKDWLAALGHFDKFLIDPPREGAIELVKALPDPGVGPRRIVYVSCNPATLARDAAVLVHQKGYALRGAGIVNMFPQTSHVESIALFER